MNRSLAVHMLIYFMLLNVIGYNFVLTNLKLKLKMKSHQTNPLIHFDLEKLNNPKLAEIFKDIVGNKFATLDCDVDNLAENNDAQEMLRWQKKKK